MQNLTPAKKAQLDEVANLMLDIYRTLVRMRYLDDSWIQEGPHDIDALIPMYRAYNLDDSIIYLYSILPYVDAGGATDLDFFQGGQFADFRLEGDVKRGRDPFLGDETMPPSYMTPLSLLGNHRSVISYNARRHWIAICDDESGGSTDHTRWLSVEAVDNGRDEGKEDGPGLEQTSEDETDSEGGEMDENEDEDEDEDEDDESSDEEGGNWDEMDSRPAGDVLRDIVRWYHDLIETPGGGDLSCVEWDPDVVRLLYRKHGWPGPQFDGDAFLVDLARANAYSEAERNSDNLGHAVDRIKMRLGRNGHDGPNYLRMKGAKEAAKTVEELWVARWHLWNLELGVRRDLEELQRAEKEREGAKDKAQSLGEVEVLAESLQYSKDSLNEVRHKSRNMEQGEQENPRNVRLRLRYAEHEVEILQKAYEASRTDAEVFSSGKSNIPSPMDHKISGYEGRLQLVTKYIEDARRGVEEICDWMAQLPQGADQAGTLAHDDIKAKEAIMATYLQQCHCLEEALEKCRTGGEKDI